MNYYYVGEMPLTNIKEFEDNIVGRLDEQRILEDGRIVVKTAFGKTITPECLKSFILFKSSKDCQENIS